MDSEQHRLQSPTPGSCHWSERGKERKVKAQQKAHFHSATGTDWYLKTVSYPWVFGTNLPGDTHRGERIRPACEECRPTYQQHPDVILTLLLQRNKHQHQPPLLVSSKYSKCKLDYSDLSLPFTLTWALCFFVRWPFCLLVRKTERFKSLRTQVRVAVSGLEIKQLPVWVKRCSNSVWRGSFWERDSLCQLCSGF